MFLSWTVLRHGPHWDGHGRNHLELEWDFHSLTGDVFATQTLVASGCILSWKTVDQDKMKERYGINFKIELWFILNYVCYFQLCREQIEKVNILGTKNVIEGL